VEAEADPGEAAGLEVAEEITRDAARGQAPAATTATQQRVETEES
jgi:hypothetical protein